MDKQSKIRQLLDFFSNNPEVSRQLRARFEQWLAEHADDPDVEEVLEQMWHEDYPEESLEDIVAGISRLNSSMTEKRRRKGLRRAIAVAAAVIAVFICGFTVPLLIPSLTERPEKYVLTASTEAPGRFILPDSSVVWLNAGSRLEYTGNLSGPVRQVALEGEGYFEVAKDSDRPFRVAMNHLDIEVLGTCFEARCFPDSKIEDVVLLEGSVKVTTAQGNDVVMKPGDKLDYTVASGKLAMTKVKAINYCNWMLRRMVFDSTPLEDVIPGLERRYKITIDLASGISPSKRVSMTVGNETANETMDILSRVIGASYTSFEDEIHFVPKK